MGGKGRKRREKNYQAAHGGGNSRLPPPPDPSSVDAVPSKLRKIMSLAGAAKQQFNGGKRNKGNDDDKETHAGEGLHPTSTEMKRKRNDPSLVAPSVESHQISTDEKKKRKRKRKQANDLRFQTAGVIGAAVSQRKERKKQRLEAMKKKHKMPKTEDVDFPGREEIKFGEVVEAPPKLMFVPKGLKKSQDASQERLRLQAVDAYRKRKGWVSRPGVQLPPPVTT